MIESAMKLIEDTPPLETMDKAFVRAKSRQAAPWRTTSMAAL